MDEYDARAVAAQWQSSGTIGSHLAAFASGARVSKVDLLDDIDNTIRNDRPAGGDLDELNELKRYVERSL